MPMDFPDLPSLKRTAEIHGFRQPEENESEANYRAALADHVEDIDFIEGNEIRTGKGWDKWTNSEKRTMLVRRMR